MKIKPLKDKLELMLSVIGFILAVSLALNFIQFHKRNKATPSRKELIMSQQMSKNLTTELQNARIEINRYKGISSNLDEVIREANLKIDQQALKIRTLTSERQLLEEENLKLSGEIDSIGEMYLSVIDSLLVERKSNSTLNRNIAQMQDRIEELNTRLGYMERLSVENLIVIPQKRDVLNRFSTTMLAKKTVQIRICGDIMPNPVAKSGLETLLVRILSPSGEVLTDSPGISGSFKHPEFGVETPYTLSEAINYRNEKINVCFKWKETGQYFPGLYIVELYTKEYKMGMVTFTLR
jgi:predicted  nucleic acid-binding Zn-ribbon protein